MAPCIIERRAAQSVYRGDIHVCLLHKPARRLEAPVARRQMQCSPLVVIADIQVDAVAGQGFDRIEIILCSSVAELHGDVERPEGRASFKQDGLHLEVVMANRIGEWSSLPAVLLAELDAVENNEIAHGFDAAVASREVQGAAIIVIARVRVEAGMDEAAQSVHVVLRSAAAQRVARIVHRENSPVRTKLINDVVMSMSNCIGQGVAPVAVNHIWISSLGQEV
mmetsp:Transcript_23737/g.77176  ORF Transcript_23737/g.77176 Transcript_23737/m.77176 type:complete len:223 (-) Transcript_23737:5312-5980(-)